MRYDETAARDATEQMRVFPRDKLGDRAEEP